MTAQDIPLDKRQREKRLAATIRMAFKSDAVAMLGGLSPRQRDILRLLYWDGWTQVAIAKKLGVHETRVNQLRNRAFEILERRIQ
jgi:RNA polymerase sigma factor (sigma-70 family)